MTDWLVTFAVATESRPFRRQRDRWASMRILETGIGPQAAARALEREFSSRLPDQVLTCGFAGGLRPELRVGDVLFSSEPAGELARRLTAAGAQPARFVGSPRVLAFARDKQSLHEQTGADAVDMESAVIVARCHDRGIPVAVVRVVSDAADEDLPLDFGRLIGLDGRMRWGRFLAALAGSPHQLVQLIRWQRRLRRAAERLAVVLARAVSGGLPPGR